MNNPYCQTLNFYNMKTLIRFLFMAAFTSLLFACSEQEIGVDVLDETRLKAASPTAVFVVYPNGGDDTPAILEAFDDAKVAGPGSVVQLVEGTYHLNFIEIREFKGSFNGAGKGKTVITTVPDLSVDAMISLKINTVLIRFVGGDVCMSNMTVMTPPGPLSTGAESFIDALAGFSARTYQYTSMNDYINVIVDNVEFNGHWENINHGLKAEFGVRANVKVTGGWPLSPMNISVTNSSFDGFNYFGALIQHLNGGKIIAGTKNCGNIFHNNSAKGSIPFETGGGGSLGLWSNVNVEISVAGNTFLIPGGTRWGIEIFSSPVPARLAQVLQTKVTVCNIEHNVYNITGGVGGVSINDRRRFFYPEELPLVVHVKNNTFNLVNDAFAGISSCNMKGMVIRNNKFEGNGHYGVRVIGPIVASSGQTPLPPNDNGLMLGNNFRNSIFSVASVLLDERTNNWTIVGGNLGETLIDMTNGTGNHLITGMNVNTSDVPLGQTISDNLP
jgi:hypothetical protein